jgi:hypothetical protein
VQRGSHQIDWFERLLGCSWPIDAFADSDDDGHRAGV